MPAGKHRAPKPSRRRFVAFGTLPVVLAVVGARVAQADPVVPQSGPAVTAPGATVDSQGAAESQGTAGGQAQAQAQATSPSPSTFQIGDVQFNAPSWLDAGVVASVNQALISMGMGHNQNNAATQNGTTQNTGGATTDVGTAAGSAADPAIPSVNH